jgi:LPS-assembly protein
VNRLISGDREAETRRHGDASPLLTLCSLCLLICLLSNPWVASSESLMKTGLTPRTFVSSSKDAWTVDAGKITYDYEKKLYEAEENVRVSSVGRSIQADWALLDTQKQQVELKGHVLLKFGNTWIQGEHVIWNLDSETGWVDGGMAYFAETHFYVQGKSISKTGANTYELEKGFLTTCDPSNADWRIKYNKMTVELGGYAWAKDASFWARNLPLIYTPTIGLPVKQERQSGLLPPWLGTSTLNGVQGELPFYWAIRQDMDATIYGRMMEKRGWMSGLEYRLNNEKLGEGIWQANYLYDQANAEFEQQQGYPLQTRNRFWVRSRDNLTLPYQIKGHLDLDVVSDPNYLKEFLGGSTAYDYSNRIFLDRFGRGILNDNTVSYRESTLYLERPFESTLLSLDTRYWDQTDRALQNLALQRLPSFSFNAIPTRLDGLPFYYSMESSLTDYWRSQGTKGNRLDLFPRLSLPLHWNSYLDVEPSAGVRSSNYWVDWQDNSRNPWQGRLQPDVQVEISSRLNRVYPLDLGNYQAIQHAIRPEIIYEYVPQVSRLNDLPSFGTLDSNQTRHDLLVGFSTFLTGKQVQKDAENNPSASYRELARLEILQQFNIEKPPLDLEYNPVPKTGFANLFMRLDVMPQRYLTFSYYSTLFPDQSRSIQHDLYMTLDSNRGQLFRLGYQYRYGFPIDEVTTELGLRILPNLALSTYHDYSFYRQELFKQAYGLRYVHGCWSIGFVYEKEPNDQRFMISINLFGLGTVGSSQGFGLINPLGAPW